MKLVGRDAFALAGEEFGDRLAEAGMNDIMCGPRLHRLIAAGELVAALCPCLDAGEAPRDRLVDCLVVTQLEMQERLVDERAPIAPVERVATDEIERAGDRHALGISQDEQDLLTHPLTDQRESLARQVGLA